MAFPVQTVLDNFNRANGGLGTNWTTFATESAPRIVSEQFAAYEGGSFSAALYTATKFADNQAVFVEVAAGESAGLFVRAEGENGYYAEFEKGDLSLYRLTKNAVAATLVSKATLAIKAGDKIGVTAVEAKLEVWHGETLGGLVSVASASDSTYTQGYIGAAAEGSVTRLDNFGGGTIAFPNPYPPDSSFQQPAVRRAMYR